MENYINLCAALDYMYCITSKADKDSLELAKTAANCLREIHIRYALIRGTGAAGYKKELTGCEILIAIGDDKFILETFRRLGKLQVPVFAVASAQSFLSQANSLNLKYCLGLIKKGRYKIFKRARLMARLDNSSLPIGLNDIGLFCSKSASLLKYSLMLNNELFWKDSSDGIVVSTPTGSTGYSLSAGGPIVLDEPSIFTITSISSLEKHSPIVVSDGTKIKISGIKGSSPVLIVDGDVRIPIRKGEVLIEKSPYDANFVIFSKEYSLESRLRKRTLKVSTGRLKSMPASAKLIYKILAHEGSMTQKEIINASMLPERTVRHALDMLLKSSLITRQPHFTDARQAVYGA